MAPCTPVKTTLHLAVGSECPPYQPGVLRCYSMKFCPYAQRTRLILIAKNVEHEIININLKSRPEWFLKKNPLSKVPTLEQDGRLMYESLVTCEYLNDAYPNPPLYPKDPWARGQDRMFMEVWGSKVASIMNQIYLKEVNKNLMEEIITNVQAGLELFETELKKRGTKFFAGDKPGMLDYMIWPWGERLPMVLQLWGEETEINSQHFPKLFTWMDCMKEDEVVKAVYMTPNTFLKYFQERPNGVPEYDLEEVP